MDSGTQTLDGISAIVVEDNFSVASGLKFMLEGYGCNVRSMCPDVESALREIATATFDVAILDIDLKGESVVPVAQQLRARRDPFLFLSGFGEENLLPPELRTFPRLMKPVSADELMSAILGVLGAAAGSG